MKLHTAMEIYSIYPSEYEGFSTRINPNILYKIHKGKILYKSNGDWEVIHIDDPEFILRNDFILVPKKIPIPNGYYEDISGNIKKSISIELWVNIYRDDKDNIYKYTFFEETKANNNISNIGKSFKFIKQIHIKQQCTIPYDFEFIKST